MVKAGHQGNGRSSAGEGSDLLLQEPSVSHRRDFGGIEGVDVVTEQVHVAIEEGERIVRSGDCNRSVGWLVNAGWLYLTDRRLRLVLQTWRDVDDPESGPGTTEDQRFGTEVAALGDANGDGLPDLAVASLDGPGFANVNLALIKHVAVGPHARLQLRVEAFNLFNRTNFGLPDGFFGSPTFGQILSASEARRIQVGARMLF